MVLYQSHFGCHRVPFSVLDRSNHLNHVFPSREFLLTGILTILRHIFIRGKASKTVSIAEKLVDMPKALSSWLSSNRLQKLWKTRLGNRWQLQDELHNLQLCFTNASSTSVCDLGITLNQELVISEHVKTVYQTCFYHLCQIHHLLFVKPDSTLMLAFMCTRVDYGNAIKAGLPRYVKWYLIQIEICL